MRTVTTLVSLVILLGVVAASCGSPTEPEHRFPGRASRSAQGPGQNATSAPSSTSTSASASSQDTSPVGKIEVPPPPFSKGMFPCSECHDPEIPVNTKRRTFKRVHSDIDFKHDAEHRWCLDCHAVKDRDKLHLANGDLIDFEESFKLCGQCHGDKYRDWRAGVHGRRSGDWNGHKTYLLCVHCHNSHSPRFQPMKPMPPPVHPRDLAKEIVR